MINQRMRILLVAPYAPPINSPEAIQVQRILAELDKRARGRLVMVAPGAQDGWARQDESLARTLQHFDTQMLALPFHRFTNRVLTSHRLKRWHVPDALWWIADMRARVLRELPEKPDIIYSRSGPTSGAILAYRLKQKLGVPWVMHLSDPWVGNVGKHPHPRNQIYEEKCFALADAISLTTRGQAEHYRYKYPDFAHKIFVSPNVMPEMHTHPHPAATGAKLHLVHAGTMYGEISPRPLLQALALLRRSHPEILPQLRIDFYGNAHGEAAALLHNASDMVHYHGPVSYAVAYAAQALADVIITLEVDSQHPFIKATLLSKIMNCLALGKPLLAITPEGSETEHICEEGYGWAIAPSDPAAIAARLVALVQDIPKLRAALPKAPPTRYLASVVVEDLLVRMRALLAQEHKA